jgi:hypothetical protein
MSGRIRVNDEICTVNHVPVDQMAHDQVFCGHFHSTYALTSAYVVYIHVTWTPEMWSRVVLRGAL